MDIKSGQVTQTAKTPTFNADGRPILSFFDTRTMQQDLAVASGQRIPPPSSLSAAIPLSPRPFLVTSLPKTAAMNLETLARAAAEEKQLEEKRKEEVAVLKAAAAITAAEQKEEAIRKKQEEVAARVAAKVAEAAKQKEEADIKALAARQAREHQEELSNSYKSAKALVAVNNPDEAISKLEQIISDNEVGWWLKWRIGRLLDKARKLLMAPKIVKEEKTVVATSPSTFTSPPVSPPVFDINKPILAEPKISLADELESNINQFVKLAAPPPDLPIEKPIAASETRPIPEIKIEEKIIPLVASAESQVLPPPLPPLSSMQPRPLILSSKSEMPEADFLLQPPEKPLAKPTGRDFNWGKIILIGGILAVVLLAVGFWFFWQSSGVSPSPSPIVSFSPTSSPLSPSPTPLALFETDKQVVVQLAAKGADLSDKLQQQLANIDEPAGSFVSMLLKNSDGEFLSLDELASLAKIDFFDQPIQVKESTFKSQLDIGKFTLFVYSQASASSSSPFSAGANFGRLGLAVALKSSTSSEELLKSLRDLEQFIIPGLELLLSDVQNKIPAKPVFADSSYQNIAIRYINFPTPDHSLDYAVLKNRLIFATSKESMRAAIDRVLSNE